MLSATQISTYKNCPRQYKFKYIDFIEEKPNEYSEIAMEFGKEFHENVLNNTSQTKEIKEMIQALHSSKFKDFAPKIIKLEDNYTTTINGHPFRVILDAVGEDFICEFKTARDIWDKDKFDSEVQSIVYQLAEKERTGKVKKFMYFIVTKPGKGKKITVQVVEINNINEKKEKDLLKVCDDIKNDFEFIPTGYKKNGACFFCGFKDYCETQM